MFHKKKKELLFKNDKEGKLIITMIYGGEVSTGCIRMLELFEVKEQDFGGNFLLQNHLNEIITYTSFI